MLNITYTDSSCCTCSLKTWAFSCGSQAHQSSCTERRAGICTWMRPPSIGSITKSTGCGVAFLAVFLALPDRLDYSSGHYFTPFTESLLACFSRARRFLINPLELPLSGNEGFPVDSLLS